MVADPRREAWKPRLWKDREAPGTNLPSLRRHVLHPEIPGKVSPLLLVETFVKTPVRSGLVTTEAEGEAGRWWASHRHIR